MDRTEEVALWRAVFGLRDAIDRLPRKAEDEDNHFYGAWVGGSASSGGHPKPTGQPVSGKYYSSAARVDRAIGILGKSLTISDREHRKVQRHLRDLAEVPPGVLRSFVNGGGKIEITSKPASHIAGHPRGWHEGATWADVPGVFDPSANRVFMGDTTNHGSTSLALHELGHGMDYYASASREESWVAAWHQRAGGSAQNPYFGQLGGAGGQEMFAEAFAIQVKLGNAEVSREFGPQAATEMQAWMDIWQMLDNV